MLITNRSFMLLISILSLLCLIFNACGNPSDRDIQQAVTASLKREVPIGLARNLLGGKDAQIEQVSIVQKGSAQGEGSNKYWPIKVYAKGSCTVMFGGRRHFEGEAEFYVSKDAYGNWVATSSK